VIVPKNLCLFSIKNQKSFPLKSISQIPFPIRNEKFFWERVEISNWIKKMQESWQRMFSLKMSISSYLETLIFMPKLYVLLSTFDTQFNQLNNEIF